MRLIDADALLKKAGDAWDSHGHLLYAVGTGDIMLAPTVDTCFCWNSEKNECELYPTVNAVEVVRCKDCKHYGFTENRIPQEQVWWCYKWSNVTRETDFCSYGERKR